MFVFVHENKTGYMKEMEARYGGSRASWFLGAFGVVFFFLWLIGGLALLTNLVGFLYPAFASFKVCPWYCVCLFVCVCVCVFYVFVHVRGIFMYFVSYQMQPTIYDVLICDAAI